MKLSRIADRMINDSVNLRTVRQSNTTCRSARLALLMAMNNSDIRLFVFVCFFLKADALSKSPKFVIFE